MIVPRELGTRERTSVLGRASALTKLVVGFAWLFFLILTLDPRPAATLVVAAIVGGVALGRVAPSGFLRSWLPFALAALGVLAVNTLFGSANADPAAAEMLRLGPLRITEPALSAGVALALRVLAVAGVGVAFASTTDATSLADSLVQQGRLPERFAYGALAAFQAVPRVAEDLQTLQQARRIRGLRTDWDPRILLALLVLAVRHAERLALAMDARGFEAGVPRSRYRVVRWGPADAIVLALGSVALLAAIAVAHL